MRRIVLLSTLTPGRCFTLVEPPADFFEEDDRGERVVGGRSILTPDVAWKIATIDEVAVEAENALGELRRFNVDSRVVELPRQGWDRLSARVRGEA